MLLEDHAVQPKHPQQRVLGSFWGLQEDAYQ